MRVRVVLFIFQERKYEGCIIRSYVKSFNYVITTAEEGAGPFRGLFVNIFIETLFPINPITMNNMHHYPNDRRRFPDNL